MTSIGNSDLDILPLSLGGNVFGWTADRDASFAILDAFTAGGGNFVDTADVYSAFAPGNSGGESETLIGEWIASRGRDKLIVATKVSRHPDFPGLAPENVRRAVDASLTRLGSDHIDLYYAHFDDLEVPIAEIAGTFSELVDAGKIRYPAISNTSPERIDAWLAAAAADGLHPPVALQPHYSLVERGFESDGLRDAAQRHGLGVLPYYALASGFLTGKYRPGTVVDSVRATGAARYLERGGADVLAVLDEVAAAHATSVAAVSLAWLRYQPTVVAPIASASRPEQVADLLASTALELTTEELSALADAGR